MRMTQRRRSIGPEFMVALTLTGIFLSQPACLAACPGYEYLQQKSIDADNRSAAGEGHSAYLHAEQERKVKVLEAQALFDSAKLQADAEVERAKGVAAANKIIGESLKENPDYIRWLWVKELGDSGHNKPSIIYVPTEAGLPILESMRLMEPAR